MTDKAFRMRGVGGTEHAGALLVELPGATEVHVGGRVVADARVSVLVVVLMWVIPSSFETGRWFKTRPRPALARRGG